MEARTSTECQRSHTTGPNIHSWSMPCRHNSLKYLKYFIYGELIFSYLVGGAEGHDEEADQAVRHGEARDQVVGGGVEAALLQGAG